MHDFSLTEAALKSAFPDNEIIYDNAGLPSVMVRIPKMTYAELGLGSSTATFPAFIVNGQEVDEIYISKYQNVVINGLAYSIPVQGPKTAIIFDDALEACAQKGSGWHLMTAMEWGFLIAWCERNGFMPRGNNYDGKHATEDEYVAIQAQGYGDDYVRVLTGTGPISWNHDNTPAGIADLCGNVWEWAAGIRSVYGEVQVLENNNAADSDNSQETASVNWKAIDAASGELVTPNGSGTTSGTVKMGVKNGKLTFDTTIENPYMDLAYDFVNHITCSNNIGNAAKSLLIALGMMHKEGSISVDAWCYFDSGKAERMFMRGGTCTGTHFNFASFRGLHSRTLVDSNIGFRSAYLNIQN